MTQQTIHDLPLNGGLDGTEEVEIQLAGAGASQRTTTQAIANLGGGGSGFPQTLTAISSGASPVTAPYTHQLYEITSGGTDGDEFIDLDQIPFSKPDGSPSMAPEWNGYRVTFYLNTQTAAGDRVILTVSGGDASPYVYPVGDMAISTFQRVDGGVVLDFEGACATFVWTSEVWKLDYSLSDGLMDPNWAERLNKLGGTVSADLLPNADPGQLGHLYFDPATSGVKINN